MDLSIAISAVAVAISFITLAVSAPLAVRQLRLARQAAHVPTFLDMFKEFRSLEFHNRYQYVVL